MLNPYPIPYPCPWPLPRPPPLPPGAAEEGLGASATAATHAVRSAEALCPVGHYCVGGTAVPCPAGRYGGVQGLQTAECEGACLPGEHCPAGAARPVLCPKGRYCPDGYTASPCPAGRYGARMGLSSEACTGLCEAGYYCPAGSASRRQVSYCPPTLTPTRPGPASAHALAPGPCPGPCPYLNPVLSPLGRHRAPAAPTATPPASPPAPAPAPAPPATTARPAPSVPPSSSAAGQGCTARRGRPRRCRCNGGTTRTAAKIPHKPRRWAVGRFFVFNDCPFKAPGYTLSSVLSSVLSSPYLVPYVAPI